MAQRMRDQKARNKKDQDMVAILQKQVQQQQAMFQQMQQQHQMLFGLMKKHFRKEMRHELFHLLYEFFNKFVSVFLVKCHIHCLRCFLTDNFTDLSILWRQSSLHFIESVFNLAK